MYRAIAIVVAVVALGIVSRAAPTPKQSPSPARKVSQRANFPGVDDARATLNDALDILSKLYEVSFDINDKAFALDGVMEAGKTEIAVPPIPPMKNVLIERVLRKILSRLPAPTGATYCVRRDSIEITTGAFQKAEIWGSYRGPYLPLVNATLDKVPLEDAVRKLADQADFNVVVDNRAGEKAKTLVSARLLNTPLDSALRLLTDMADLQTVQIDNVLYITSKANAAALEVKLEEEKAVGKKNPETPNAGERKGSGPDSVPSPEM